MCKQLTLFILILSPLLIQAEFIEILGDELKHNHREIRVQGDVVAHVEEKTLKTQSIHYQKEKEVVDIENDVAIWDEKSGFRLLAKKMHLNLKTKSLSACEVFGISDNDLWFIAKRAKENNDTLRLQKSFFSGCEIDKSLWKIYFDEAVIDKQKKIATLRHPVWYIGKIPFFYFPYLSFSLNNTRKSGFLFPTFGYNEYEGLMFVLPYFWAIDFGKDLELRPQVRYKRGSGLFATFRFVDSPHSHGRLNVGYFKDKTSYLQLRNQTDATHKGVEFYYTSKNFFPHRPRGFSDTLYVDTIWLDDIEYINLQKSSIGNFGNNALQESRINWVTFSEKHFILSQIKYFIDTSRSNNDETLQQLPTLRWHRYTDEIKQDLYYSIDLRSINHYRKVGANLWQNEIFVPLFYKYRFFDDLLFAEVQMQLFYGNYRFSNEPFEIRRFSYSSLNQQLSLKSSLYKTYDRFSHIVLPSLIYTKPGFERQSPVTFELLDQTQKDLFFVGLPEEKASIAISNYFYDNTGKEKLFYRLFGDYYPKRRFSLPQIGQEVAFEVQGVRIYNEITYVPEYKKVRKSLTRIRYGKNALSVSLAHTLQKKLPDRNDRDLNTLVVQTDYRHSPHLRFFGTTSYALDESSGRFWRAGFEYQKACFGLYMGLEKERIPKPKNFSDEFRFFFEVDFKPLFSIGNKDRR